MHRTLHILAFFTLLIFILVGTHAYIYLRLSDYLYLTDGLQQAFLCVTATLAAALVVALPTARFLPRYPARIVSWLAYGWMGCLLILFGCLCVADVISISKAAFFADAALPTPSMLGWGTLGTAAILSVIGFVSAHRAPIVKTVTVTLDKLPHRLDGFKLVQISDVHMGPVLHAPWLERVVERINTLAPDAVAITGDLMDGPVWLVGGDVEPLADIKSRFGTYYITGNHEYYSGVAEWNAFLPSLGIRTLRNECVTIADGLQIAGIDDVQGNSFEGHGPDLDKALATRDANAALILLDHQPRAKAVKLAAAKGVDLQLSGHTHGGQIWPGNWVVRAFFPYAEGLKRVCGSTMQVYTSPGTGFWGPPMRLGTRSEITCIILKSRILP